MQDLDLIDVLWQQDVDLGLGKEVFDAALRQELEKEREQEIKKQHDEVIFFTVYTLHSVLVN